MTRQEADAQEFAHRNTDKRFLRVPQVFDFFTELALESSIEHGYLVMEYIRGNEIANLQPNERLDLVPRISLQ